MAPNQSFWRSILSSIIRCPIARMNPSLTGETQNATFTFVMLKRPLMVNQGQRSRCTITNWAMVNTFVYRQAGPMSNRYGDMGHFHFRDHEMTSSRSCKVSNCFWRILKVPIVFHSNHILILHHQEGIGDLHIPDLQLTIKGHSR